MQYYCKRITEASWPLLSRSLDFWINKMIHANSNFLQNSSSYSTRQNLLIRLVFCGADISAWLHTLFLQGSSEWTNNYTKISFKSCLCVQEHVVKKQNSRVLVSYECVLVHNYLTEKCLRFFMISCYELTENWTRALIKTIISFSYFFTLPKYFSEIIRKRGDICSLLLC